MNRDSFPSLQKTPAAGMALPCAFGRYMLFDYIGRGGMAEIYLGRQTTELGAARLSVVKQILFEYADRPQFAEMLVHEAKLAANLNHANIVQVFDLGRVEKKLFIAMEYVDGFDLNALLRRCSKEKVPLPLEFALYVLTSVLRGLDYAHRRLSEDGTPLGIVHRDVSPSNILISFDGDVKLCDFGIARANDRLAIESATDDAIQGKAGYMSPEHARGDLIDARADVFAVGIVAWELLAGKRMYTAPDRNRAVLLEKARAGDVPPLPKRGFPHEDELHGIIDRALRFAREDRTPSAQAMLRDLENYTMKAQKMASPLRFGEWLLEHFGTEVVALRRTRERAALALAKGPLLVMTPIAAPDTKSERIEEPAPAKTEADVSAQLAALPKPPPRWWMRILLALVILSVLGELLSWMNH